MYGIYSKSYGLKYAITSMNLDLVALYFIGSILPSAAFPSSISPVSSAVVQVSASSTLQLSSVLTPSVSFLQNSSSAISGIYNVYDLSLNTKASTFIGQL